ncbi:hypothetical protein LCL89_01690 [Halobacillus yeomjeoni]|uniref:hypothetical protein n=1 Tax=Halobacillus yeomjeoni TaxID=311194 RepID=UPI001CD4BBFE|nr:hypothetical protein [Halobacillus yeomjeoni]MCA0982749.1 hypothetical protein [Halobacillus yeomjeoni]
MKKVWLYWVLGPLVIAVFISIITNYTNEEAVIKYFPLDDKRGFKTYETSLKLALPKDDDEYEVEWGMFSETDEPMYLRQDVSLLYVNGRLKGIMSKWEQNASIIKKETIIHGEDSKKYEAISFHHGEIHEKDESIKSIQATSRDTLYVIDSPLSDRTAFKEPSTPEEKEWKKRLNHSIDQQIQAQWDELLNYYQIPTDQYIPIPLTDLSEYESRPFPGTTTRNFQRIKGQLWEGLYRNYILGISDKESSHPIQSYIPLILFDKKGTHLMVLFEDDTGKKHQLIQYY